MKYVLIIAMVVFSHPAWAMAKSPLKEEPRVKESMLAIGMADIIRKQCDTINARLFRAYGFLKSIERYAREQGYTDAEIEAYVNDDIEKANLYGIARARFVKMGVNPEDPNSYCTVGLAQIEAETLIGNLLKAK